MLAIKQTLYRTGADSPIVDALVAAAHNGKDVTVVIELRARFDEEANIALANRLQEAGVHVVYGVVGYKTHAKMMLVVRREAEGIRRYCHLGTGNYHPRTARAYTDYGLLTCDQAIGQDVHEIFLQLTSLTRTPQLRRLLQSPFTLHQRLLELIRGEAVRAARQGRPHHRAHERAGRAAGDRGAVRRLARRRAGRPGRARRLRAAAGRARRFGEHPRALDGRPVPRALARLVLRQRRDAGSVLLAAPTGWSAISSAASRSPFPCCDAVAARRDPADLETYLADNGQRLAAARRMAATRGCVAAIPAARQRAGCSCWSVHERRRR